MFDAAEPPLFVGSRRLEAFASPFAQPTQLWAVRVDSSFERCVLAGSCARTRVGDIHEMAFNSRLRDADDRDGNGLVVWRRRRVKEFCEEYPRIREIARM